MTPLDKRKLIFRVTSPAMGLVILFLGLSLVLNEVPGTRQSNMNIHIQEVPQTKERKAERKPQKRAKENAGRKLARKNRPEPRSKNTTPDKQDATASRKASPSTGLPWGKDTVPAITIYYGSGGLEEYMQALAKRGCLVLIQGVLGNFLTRYDPFTGKVSGELKDLRGYSPRSRVLAVYGENPAADRIIRQGVEASRKVSLPFGCKLASLLSSWWENALFGAVASAANEMGVESRQVESAEATFSGGRFFLNRIRTAKGTVFEVNYLLPS